MVYMLVTVLNSDVKNVARSVYKREKIYLK